MCHIDDISWGRWCTLSLCDLNLTFHFTVVTLTLRKSCLVYISESTRCKELLLGRDIGWGMYLCSAMLQF